MAAAINNNNGSLLSAPYATPQGPANPTGDDGGNDYTSIATCAIPTSATDLAGSTYRMVRVYSNDIPLRIGFSATALTAGALSVGLYEVGVAGGVAQGVTANKQLFATSINAASAVNQVDERFTNLALTTMGQRIWQLLGLAADPAKVYDLVYTSTTAATAAGTLGCVYEALR